MTTTTNVLPPPVQQEFSEKMLSTPMARLVHNLFAIPRTIDGNAGKTLRMRRYNRLQTAPVPVDPLFMNPPAQQLTAIDIDATVNWYSRHSWSTKIFFDGLETLTVKDEGNKAQAILGCAA